MRSVSPGIPSLPSTVRAPGGRTTAPRRPAAGFSLTLVALCAGFTPPALAQFGPDEELLLPEMISTRDVEMRARYVRQWREDDGTLVLMFTGGFRLEMGRRRLSADDAVVWITPKRSAPEGRKYYELTVYLSGSAEVRELAGTTIEDHALLVSNLRTFGRIIKLHDAHSPEVLHDSPLYQRALRDRTRIEAEQAPPPEEVKPLEVARPAAVRRPERPPPTVRWSLSNVDAAETAEGRIVQVATGGVYFSRSGGPDSPVLEIRADNAVVFLAEGAATLLGADLRGETREAPAEPPGREEAQPPSAPVERQEREKAAEQAAFGVRTGLVKEIEAVYLEGDVVLALGDRFVRANRIYYDFERDHALVLDAVFRADIPERGIPLYLRADEIRQLSAREFAARNARVSTSEFYTPHYHVGAERVYIRDRTVRDASGEPAANIAFTYELRNSTLNVENVPILWWPYAKGDFETSETLIRRFRTGYSDDFGVSVETAWYLFNLLGLPQPPGFDATFRLDYFSERGPAVGIDGDYEREDYFGLLRNYYIYDEGEDNLGPLRDNVPDDKNRGRVLWRHRHYLPNDWEATLEIAYASDPGFLEEYEKSEWFEGKEQETVLYLKRARDTEAISLLANWRLLDFVTQTEHLPDLTYRRIGDTWLDPVVLYHESRVGAVRFRPDDRRFFDERRFNNDGLTDVTFRTDLREEAELPIKLPGLNIVPFATGRGTYWDGQPLGSGGLWRGLGVYGIRGGAYLSRVYDNIQSKLFDIDRIRHIIRPHFVAWWAHSNARSTIITPFDEGIETIDDFYGAMFGVRQVWQTKRGGEGRQRTVDLLTFDLEAGFFGDRQDERSNGYANLIRPEDSRTRNYVSGDLIYRVSDTTSVLYEFNLDVNDWSFDRHNVSVAIERLPRLAYIFGWRHAGDIDLDLAGGGYNYKLSEKHITAFRLWYDMDRGELGEIAVAYVRKLPRWYFAVNFEVNEVFDDFTLSVSLWPEGIPEWTLGSRRFTGLSTTTGIRP
ncbi:MAG: LPS assembly protein LptD [Phycisphaerae bacterium]